MTTVTGGEYCLRGILGRHQILTGALGRAGDGESSSLGDGAVTCGERMDRHFWDRTPESMKEQSLFRNDKEVTLTSRGRGGGSSWG